MAHAVADQPIQTVVTADILGSGHNGIVDRIVEGGAVVAARAIPQTRFGNEPPHGLSAHLAPFGILIGCALRHEKKPDQQVRLFFVFFQAG